MNGAVKKEGRLKEVYFLYFVGVVSVIFHHSYATVNPASYDKVVVFVSSYHMPLFFAIAGYLFARSTRLPKIGYFNWAKEKTVRLLTPKIVLNAIAFLPIYYLDNSGFSGLGLKVFAEKLLMPRQSVWGHFWFLPVLLIMYLFFGLHKNKKYEKPFLVLMFVFTLCLHFYKTDILWLGLSDIVNFAFYFVLGEVLCVSGILKRRYGNSVYAICGFVSLTSSILLYVFFGTGEFIGFIEIISALLGLYCISVIAAGFKLHIVEFVGEKAFTFYIYSWPAQAAAQFICERLGASFWVTMPAKLFAGLLFPAAVIVIYEKSKFLHCKFSDMLLGLRI